MCPYSTSRAQLRIEGLTQPPMGPGPRRLSTHQPHEAPHIHRSEALTPVTSQPRCPRAASLTQTNFARNFPRSFFETTQKRCNSNDVNSRFELLAGELRAKLLIDSHNRATSNKTQEGAAHRHTAARARPGSQDAGLAAVPEGGRSGPDKFRT